MVAVDKIDPAHKTSDFAIAMRGYNQRQVDERVTRLSADLEATARSRDEAVATAAELTKALSYVQQELTDAKAGLVRMSSSPSGAGAMAERVRMMMQLAEEEIAELKARAEEDAAATRAEADKYAHTTHRTAEQEAKKMLAEQQRRAADAQAESDRLNIEADELRQTLDAEAQQRRDAADAEAWQRRDAADKQAADVLAARKAEAYRVAAAEEAAVKDRVGKIVADAENRRSVAEEQAKQALEFRRRVTEQMTLTNAALQEALRHLAPYPPSEDETEQESEEDAESAPTA
jgi:chromosome segregation ATPase